MPGKCRGWFHHFYIRTGLHNIKFSGEAASADAQATSAYPAHFKMIIEEGGFIT